MAEGGFGSETSSLVVVSGPREALAILRVHDAGPEALGALAAAIGCRLPTEPNRSETEAVQALWLGPREWLLIGGVKALSERIAAVPDVGLFHLVGVGEGTASFDISGRNARDLLATGTSFDLDPKRFGPGRCARTLLAQIGVFIHRRSEGAYRIYFDISYADYIATWLGEASREFLPRG